MVGTKAKKAAQEKAQQEEVAEAPPIGSLCWIGMMGAYHHHVPLISLSMIGMSSPTDGCCRRDHDGHVCGAWSTAYVRPIVLRSVYTWSNAARNPRCSHDSHSIVCGACLGPRVHDFA